MKWTLKNQKHTRKVEAKIDGAWKLRTITTYGDVEVTLDDDGITEMAHRALGNTTGRARQGHFKSKVITRSTETSDWEAR
jgi:hypothetical protein